MAFNLKKSSLREPMSEINVTPFVDVMLVLLIIFMVTAPLLTVGVQVDLPESSADSLPEEQEPLTLTINSKGEIFIADWRNDRIQIFSTNGEFITKFGESGQEDGQFNRPSSVTVDTQGLIYIADWGNERIQILDKEGNFITKLRGDAGLSKWADEFMIANVDEATAREKSEMEPNLPHLKNDPHEESSHIEKLFWGPVSVNIDLAGRLYVTESNRHRIQVFDWSR